MRRRFGKVAAAAAILGISGPALAAPAAKCITPAEMRGGIAYFLPPVIAEIQDRCRPHLRPGSYLLTGASQVATTLEANKGAHWPMAKAAFLKMGDQGDSRKLADLPDEALRPLVDTMLGALLKFNVTPATCGEINDIAEALAPLGAEATVNLVATVFSTVARKDRKVRSCPRIS